MFIEGRICSTYSGVSANMDERRVGPWGLTCFFGAFLDNLLGGCFRVSLGSDETTILQSCAGSSLEEPPLGLEAADNDVGKWDGVDRLEDASE